MYSASPRGSALALVVVLTVGKGGGACAEPEPEPQPLTTYLTGMRRAQKVVESVIQPQSSLESREERLAEIGRRLTARRAERQYCIDDVWRPPVCPAARRRAVTSPPRPRADSERGSSTPDR